jgi:hypothetical protein
VSTYIHTTPACLPAPSPVHPSNPLAKPTDSFSGTFRPCSLDRPKVLLPLLNVPMLDYVMEFLVSSGVQEVGALGGGFARVCGGWIEWMGGRTLGLVNSLIDSVSDRPSRRRSLL